MSSVSMRRPVRRPQFSMHAFVLAVACFAGLFAVTRLMAGWLVHCSPSSPVTCPFCNASPDLLLPLLVGDPADQVWDRFHRGEVMIIDTDRKSVV